MAGRLTLDQLIGVRVPVPQFFTPQGCFASLRGPRFFTPQACFAFSRGPHFTLKSGLAFLADPESSLKKLIGGSSEG